MYLIRVDDFPRPQGKMNLDKFIEFNSILEKYNIPYLLGVIPNMALDDRDPDSQTRFLTKEEVSVLKKLKNVRFAMHGVMHRTLKKEYHSEFVGLDEKSLDEKIKEGLKIFQSLKLETDAIMPPFNTFDLSNLQVFKKYFKIVTGGPETIKIFGKLPIGNLDGILYIPSYEPFYGKGRTILNAVKKEEKGIKCITFHWGWEADDNFTHVKNICMLIKDRVIPWNFNMLQTILY